MIERPIPITRYLSLLYRSVQRFFAARLRELPLDAGQLPLLLQLYRTPGMTQEQLAQTIVIDKGTTARSVALLLQHGLIERWEDPVDRRAYRLYPTGRARELEDSLFAITGSLQKVLFVGMDEREQAQATALVRRMGENITAYFEEHPTRAAREGDSGKGKPND